MNFSRGHTVICFFVNYCYWPLSIILQELTLSRIVLIFDNMKYLLLRCLCVMICIILGITVWKRTSYQTNCGEIFCNALDGKYVSLKLKFLDKSFSFSFFSFNGVGKHFWFELYFAFGLYLLSNKFFFRFLLLQMILGNEYYNSQWNLFWCYFSFIYSSAKLE